MSQIEFTRPEMARRWKDKDDKLFDDSYAVAAVKKVDGHRLHAIHDGTGVRLLSRTGKEMNVPWLEAWMWQAPVGTYLDGELYVTGPLGESASNSVGHLRARDASKLSVLWFDCLWYAWEDVRQRPLGQRHAMLDTLDAGHPHAQVAVEELVFHDKQVYGAAYNGDGGEGLIMKSMNEPYRPGARRNVKWKPKLSHMGGDTVDAIVTSADKRVAQWRVRPGGVDKKTGGVAYAGMESSTWEMGYVVLGYGYVDDGREKAPRHRRVMVDGVRCIEVGTTGMSGIPDEMVQYVGRVMEMDGWGLYETGAIRHPGIVRFRDEDEKAMEECVFPI